MKRFCLPLACLFLLSAVMPADAACGLHQAAVIHQQVFAQHAVHHNAVQVVAAAVVVPAYGAAYHPGYKEPTAEGDDETKELLKKSIEGQNETNALLRALLEKQGVTAPGNPSATAAGDARGILKTQCADCHTGDKAKADFQMFTDKGEPVKLSPADRRAIVDRLNGRGAIMPPPPKKIAAADKAAVEKFLK